jgi:phosphatidylglycerophosphatase A
LSRLLATWFGCGYSPVAPGTAGSLAAILIALMLNVYGGWGASEFALLSLAALGPAIGVAHATAASTGRKDPGIVVIDEVVGQWVALVGASRFGWKSWLAAFLLFRLMDIWKPPPVRQLEGLPGGVGIVADDVMAGIYAALLLHFAGSFNLY